MLAVGLAAALAAGCASGPTAGEGGRSAAAPASARTDLRGLCPDPVVVQTSWFSQVEHFVAYQLLGQGYTVDADRKRVTGPLVAHGADTGVRIEIRAGGPAIGFQQVSAQMYADRSITLGMIPLDEAIQNSVGQPVTGVMTPYDVDPLVIMWDPATHPAFNTIADIGQTDTKVLFFNGERTYMDYLLGTGQLRQSQVDGSYDGSPDRLAAVPRRDRRAGLRHLRAVEVGARGAGLGQAAALPAGVRLRLPQLPQPAGDPVRRQAAADPLPAATGADAAAVHCGLHGRSGPGHPHDPVDHRPDQAGLHRLGGPLRAGGPGHARRTAWSPTAGPGCSATSTRAGSTGC